MKVLAGIYSKDAGRIVYKGREVDIPDPDPATAEANVSAVFQQGWARGAAVGAR